MFWILVVLKTTYSIELRKSGLCWWKHLLLIFHKIIILNWKKKHTQKLQFVLSHAAIEKKVRLSMYIIFMLCILSFKLLTLFVITGIFLLIIIFLLVGCFIFTVQTFCYDSLAFVCYVFTSHIYILQCVSKKSANYCIYVTAL